MTDMVTTASVSGEDVNHFLELLDLLQSVPGSIAHAALLTCLLQNLGPDDITQDELITGVRDVSAWLMLYVSTIRQPQMRES